MREVEAETTAYILLALLEPDSEQMSHSRAYIQMWMEEEYEEKDRVLDAKRVLAAADKILRAGRKNDHNDDEEED